jgi:hypothetical protein
MEQMKTKLSGKPYLVGAKHLIWDEIISEVARLWDYFKIIDDEMLLVDEADEVIHKSFHELGTRPQVATQIIKFLNSNSRETLLKKGVNDRTTMVMETERIFTKRNLIQQAQNECIALKRNVEYFSNKFENLVKMGLPSAWDKDGKLLSYEDFRKSLFISREKDDKFQNMTNTLRGQTIVDLLIDDFYLLWKTKNLFSHTPTYEKYTKLDIAFRQMKYFSYPSDATWNLLLQLLAG